MCSEAVAWVSVKICLVSLGNYTEEVGPLYVFWSRSVSVRLMASRNVLFLFVAAEGRGGQRWSGGGRGEADPPARPVADPLCRVLARRPHPLHGQNPLQTQRHQVLGEYGQLVDKRRYGQLVLCEYGQLVLCEYGQLVDKRRYGQLVSKEEIRSAS